MKKGFLLSLDALVAISLLTMISIFLVGLSYTYSSPDLRYQRYYYAGKDVVNLFEKTKMEAVSFLPQVQSYLSQGVLEQEDMNRTVLDVIGSFWASGNKSYAENLTRDIVKEILNNTAYGFDIIMNNESLYQNGSGNPDYLTRLTTIVSGYEKDKPVNGYVAKVYMTRVIKTGSEFVYFGGYVGDGNLTKSVVLTEDANMTDVYLEMNTGGNFTLYINGQQAGVYNKTSENFSADNWTVCSESVNPSYCSYFSGGNNTVSINFTGSGNSYIGGGYLKVTYRTSELTGGDYIYTGDTTLGRYWFPGIRGLINLYSSFYVPGTINNISVHLHYYHNLSLNNVSIPLYFIIGGEEILTSNETGEKTIEIPDYNISEIFGGKANLTKKLSNATIPIRFGTETFAFISGEGASDSVLITDISGSMDTCDVQTSECLHPDCNGASGCQNERIDVAKDVDKEFINTILNYTGNRAGLVSYETVVDEVHPLSNDSSSLISQINGYTEGGWTCISCGILVARDMITESRIVNTLISSKSSWLYNTNYPSSEPPADANGTSWTEHNYSDSEWGEGQSMLGFESVSYSPYIDTDIGDNGGDYYFREHFNISDADSIRFGEVYILSDDNAEIYLNGNLIDNDTEEHRAEYWSRGGSIFYDDFEGYYGDSDDHRLYDTEINRSPGYWIVDGTPSGDKEIFLMADYSGYPAHSGTDVLVFRDMDSYGHAETSLNLSGRSNLTLSYWWAMAEAFESGDYSDVWIWDGSWHELRERNRSYAYGGYLKDEIDLSGYNMIENFTIRFGAYLYSFWGGNDERFYVDDVKVSRKTIYVNKSYFRGGDNVVAVKLRNNDGDSAKFDLELNVTMDRHEAILVMSDGYANRPPGLNASKDAIDRACETRDTYGMEIYVVAFGVGADNETLERIACWNCSAGDWIPDCNRFYKSSSAEELKEIYKNIADDIANATYQAQILNVTGNVSLDNVLYPDSFISFNYTPIVRTMEYGEITLKFESPRFRDSTGEAMITDNVTGTKEGWFTIPSNTEVVTKVLDSKITSYSSYYWTDRLWVNSSSSPNQNWTGVYWLGNYSDDYEKLGDPYIIQIPSNLLTPGGNNSFKIGTGLYPLPMEDGLGGSPDDRVIYTLGITGVGLTEYSDVFPKAKGSRPTIYYDADGDNIPESSVSVDVGHDPSDVFDPENDSIDNGFMKLLDKINFIVDVNPNVADLTHNQTGPTGDGDGSPNNPIDLEVTEEVKFQSDYISKISSLWGPATMEVRVWS